jgi:hypothetical protein
MFRFLFQAVNLKAIMRPHGGVAADGQQLGIVWD